ncbi:klc-2 [Symbiodinium natans]|uniref:Klc-2 protein n=1 Tax=Symbiodinium natans TaxID=878477 RepID=A0A812QMF8_9DINO|nr:klc-2 [Symbiodinium natans]
MTLSASLLLSSRHYTHELARTWQTWIRRPLSSLHPWQTHVRTSVYGTQHEPAVWGSRTRILLNSYSNGSPLCARDDESDRVVREWGVANRQGHRGHILRADPGAQKQSAASASARTTWVAPCTMVENSAGDVQNASAGADGVLQLLRLRLAHLRENRGDVDTATLHCTFELGNRLRERSLYEEAETLSREGLAGCCAQLGNGAALACIDGLASLLQIQGRLEEAEPFFHEALHGCRARLGDGHPATLTSINNLAGLLRARRQLEEAEPLYRESLNGRRAKLGADHPHTLTSINNLAALLGDRGRMEEAEPMYREATRGRRARLGDDTLTPSAASSTWQTC